MATFWKIVVGFFILAGLVLLLTDKAIWPTYYDLPYMGWAALVCALAIWVLPKVGPWDPLKVRPLQTALALILLFNASGDMGLYELYKYGFEYDKIIHFVSPLIATLALARAYGLRTAIIIVVSGAFAWELFEFLADTFIKTHLFGVYRHQILRDTLTDIAMNVMGVVLACVVDRKRIYWTYGQRNKELS
ncbi:MAG: hypothetical protein AAB420_02790 [Patescibacteria group bacterium]